MLEPSCSTKGEDPFNGDILRRLAAGLPALRADSFSSRGGPASDPRAKSQASNSGSSSNSDSSNDDDDDDDDGSAGGHEAEEAAALRWVPQSKLPSPQSTGRGVDRLVAAALRNAEATARMGTALPLHARTAERAARKAASDTAGRRWFDLPATTITPEVKTDLRLLALRGAFDPKRFYRNPDATKFPKYFQMGTVVEGPADFFSGRMTKAERKQTLTEELLADSRLVDTHKRRFGRLQAERSKFSKRKGGVRKTSMPRLNKRPAKPKH